MNHPAAFYVRKSVAAFYILVAALVATTLIPSIANAQPVVVSGERFESLAHYLHGSWRWIRDPKVTMQIRFSPDGTFSFSSTDGVEALGTFKTETSDTIRLFITRHCNQGTCKNVNPPSPQEYPMKPVNINLYHSHNEVWERLSR